MRMFFILVLIFLVIVFCYGNTYVVAIYNTGVNLYGSGDYQKAKENFIKIYEEYPDSQYFGPSCMYLGLINYETGNVNEAIKFLKIASKKSTEGSETWKNSLNLLATIYYELGQEDKAREILNKVSKGKNVYSMVKGGKKSDQISRLQISSKQENTYKDKYGSDTKTIVQTNVVYVTNYVTNLEATNGSRFTATNIVYITNYVTNVFTNTSQLELVPEIQKIDQKLSEVDKKYEDLEELNRLVDIKNKLLKLNEKALMIQELLNKSMKETETNEK